MTINEQKNIDMVYEQLSLNEIEEPNFVSKINLFTSKNKLARLSYSFNPFIKYFKIKNFKYKFIYNDKEYQFECLSDKHLLDSDKKILKNIEIRKKNSLRALRIACSNKLTDAKLIVGYTTEFVTLVEYYKKGKKYIIDYDNNIIMEKQKYIELFDFKLINEIDQITLYHFYSNFVRNGINIDVIFSLIFSQEVLNDLKKHDSFIKNKYNELGQNNNNLYWYGDDCDCLFFFGSDTKPKEILDIIRDFTINPELKVEWIHEETDGVYYYKKGFKKIKFNLFSDVVDDEDIKKDLLSINRYGKCHYNSLYKVLKMCGKDSYLVNGMIKINDIEYYYHTWVEFEIDNKMYVIDYNSNIIMRKKDYYEIVKAKVVSITDYDTIYNLINLLYEFDLKLNSMDIGYFSHELLRDLEKNKQIIMQK